MLRTYRIVKRLETGSLKGCIVRSKLPRHDASRGLPFQPGQYVKACAGPDYTVLAVRDITAGE